MRRATVGERARFALRTAVYVGVVAISILGPILDLTGVVRVVAVALGVLAALAAGLRVRYPWLLPAVSIMAVPIVGPVLVYLAVIGLTIRRRDRATWAFVALSVLVILVPSMAGGGTIEISRADGSLASVDEYATNWAAHTVIVFVCVLIGTTIGTRRALVASLEDRAVRAESERASRAREAVLLERARIAREMHDVLGHKISLVTMQAGALEVNAGAGPAVVEREAGRIRLTAREALEDLRSVIGALEEDAAPREPGPGIAEVLGLITRYREAGAAIEVEDSVTTHAHVDGIDASAGRAIHRVLTESLTNAHRHAPGCPVRVRITGAPGDGVDLVVDNPAAPSTGMESGGTGLTGLAERVRLAGGVFDAGRVDGVFRVKARLPWPDLPRAQPPVKAPREESVG